VFTNTRRSWQDAFDCMTCGANRNNLETIALLGLRFSRNVRTLRAYARNENGWPCNPLRDVQGGGLHGDTYDLVGSERAART
jgi:hypothetical protein